jgi:hypothetical protein
MSLRRAETAQPHSWTVPASIAKPRASSERRRFSVAAGFCGSTQTTSMPVGLNSSTSQSSAVSRVLEVRRRQSTSTTSYWPAGWPQFAVDAARAKPRRCSSSISSTPLEPATTIRCCLEQPASAIIGSMIRSPVAVVRVEVMTSPFRSGYRLRLTRGLTGARASSAGRGLNARRAGLLSRRGSSRCWVLEIPGQRSRSNVTVFPRRTCPSWRAKGHRTQDATTSQHLARTDVRDSTC